MQKLSIDVTKLDKKRFRHVTRKNGDKAIFCELVINENKDGPDSYGNDGFIALDVSKEEREAGKKGEIVGNWKHLGGGKPTQQQRPAARQQMPQRPPAKRADPDLDTEGDDIPF